MTEDDDLNNVRYKSKYRYETKQPLTEEQWVKDLNARIKVLERALVKADEDYERLLKERGTTVDDAWQKYCEEMMPQKATHVYPLSGAMYKTFVAGWSAALKGKK
jgi:hypothetical protein